MPRTPKITTSTTTDVRSDSEIVIDNNAVISEQSGNTLLIEVAQLGSADILRLLLSSSSSESTALYINRRNKSSNTALIAFAAAHEQWIATALPPKHSECVDLLLDARADIDAAPPFGPIAGCTALLLVCKFKCTRCALALIARGANVNANAKYPRAGESTALQLACCETDIVTALLAKGADIDYQDSSGTTALMNAARSFRSSTCSTLLQHRADVKLRDSAGKTALLHAVESPDTFYTPCIAVLLAHGADVNQKTSTGETLLMIAPYYSIQELIDAKADVNATRLSGNTALMEICRRKFDPNWDSRRIGGSDGSACWKAMNSLLKAKANINATNHWNESALIILSQATEGPPWRDMIARNLIAGKADVNLKTRSGKSALELACQKKITINRDLIIELIQGGADVTCLSSSAKREAKIEVHISEVIVQSYFAHPVMVHCRAFCNGCLEEVFWVYGNLHASAIM